ncbi:MAG: hypothetical protein V1870_03800 [Candidatus Aenigmatarchaeota archaeon]
MRRILACLVLLLFIGVVNAAVSSTIPMQGRLLAQNGNPLTGLQNMTFKIYDVSVGGSILWSESLETQTNGGLFSVVLGESTPLTLVFDRDYYVEISVNNEPLSPRQKLLSAPYAQSARNVYGDVVETKTVSVIDSDNTGLIYLGRDLTNAIGSTIRYLQSGDYLGFRTSHQGPDQVVIKSDGKVGIGTITPSAKLEVSNSQVTGQTMQIINGSSDNAGGSQVLTGQKIILNGRSTSNVYGQIIQISSKDYNGIPGAIVNGYGTYIQPITSTANFTNWYGLYLASASGNGVINSNVAIYQQDINAKNYFGGNVGIGITSPGEKLSVLGGDYLGTYVAKLINSANVYATGNTNGLYIGINQYLRATSYALRVDVDANGDSGGPFPALVVNGLGNVGIGTTDPGKTLDVVGSVRANEICIGSECRTSWPVSSQDQQFNSLTITSNINLQGNVIANGSVKASAFCIGASCKTAWDTSANADSAKQLISNFTVASGETINAGDVVSLVNGNVRKGTNERYFFKGEFSPVVTSYMYAVKLSDDKFVVIDHGGSVLKTQIGTIIGNDVNIGVVNTHSQTMYSSKAVALAPDKFIVTYVYQSKGYAVACTVAGDVVTCGSPYDFNGGVSIDYDYGIGNISSDKFAVVYSDIGNSNYATSRIGTVSGNTISFGNKALVSTGRNYYFSLSALSSEKIAISYADSLDSWKGYLSIGSISGTTISFGSRYNTNIRMLDTNIITINSSKILFTYLSGSRTAVKIADVSGTAVVFGSEYGIQREHYNIPLSTVISDNTFVIAYEDLMDNGEDSSSVLKIGTISGNRIDLSPQYTYNPAGSRVNSLFNIPNRIMFVYSDHGTNYNTWMIMNVSSIGSVVGVAKTSGTAGQSISVIVDGISGVHTGLVSGAEYYAQKNGSLSSDLTADRMGIALSSTELLLDISR